MSDEPTVIARVSELPPIEISTAFELRFDTALRLPQALDLPFDGSMIGEGWHQWETWPGGSFRWMGIGETASVEIVVDRSIDLDVELGIYMMIAPHYDGRVVISIDGEPGHLPHVRTSAGVSFVLPRREGEGRITTVRIHAGEGTVREPDLRRLSVAFSHLRTRPENGADGNPLTLVLRERLAEQLRFAGATWPLMQGGLAGAIVGQ